ncbi:MAG: SRPBCC domain-containing protein [Anaerolineales bacterium]|nr:SRPBCC domain-containing protein [Anaerolineales bacterium]
MDSKHLTGKPDADAVNITPLAHEAVIDAPLIEVWNVWATSAGLRAWMAPHAEIDLRVGGLMRVNYNPEGQLGDPQTIINTVLSFEPQRMISIKVVKTPEGFPFPNAITQMWSVIYFAEVDSKRTAVREVSLGFTADAESQQMRKYFERGNSATLDGLQRYFTGKTK